MTRAPHRRRELARPFRVALAVALFLGGLSQASAQILTTDAGVRSPELPSLRALVAYRHYEEVEDLRLGTELVYSPHRRLELDLEVPLIARRVDVGAGHEDLFGLGDASLRAKFAVLRDDDVMRSNRVALLGRVILPTGDTDATSGGQDLPQRLQLGLGSLGVGLGAATTIVRDRHRASAAFEWVHRADHEGFDPGDQLQLDLAHWFRLSPARFDPEDPRPEWRIVVEARSRYAYRDRVAGTSSDRGLEVDGVLGLQVNAGSSWRTELGVVVPLVDDLDDPFGDAGVGLLFGITYYY